MHGVRSRIAPPWLQLHLARSPSLSLAFSGRAWCRGYGFAETPAVAPRDSAGRHVGEVRSGKATTSTRSSRSDAMRRRGIRHTHATVRPSSISWQSRERLGHAHVLFLAPRHRTLDDPWTSASLRSRDLSLDRDLMTAAHRDMYSSARRHLDCTGRSGRPVWSLPMHGSNPCWRLRSIPRTPDRWLNR